MKIRYLALHCLFAALLVAASPSHARVARILIDKVDRPADASGYEELRGRAFGVLDPSAPGNTIITDLQLAPRNAQGLVEYVTTFSLRKPIDMSKASGVLWYELVNRAGPLQTFDSMASYGHVTLGRQSQNQTGNTITAEA